MLTNSTPVTVKSDQKFETVLTDDALTFLGKLHLYFNEKRIQLLNTRKEIQEKINVGHRLDFLAETKHIREGEWTISPIPWDLQDRRVEITGPVDRKMIINALNSGAKTFMADFEDATSPTWENVMVGQQNLRDAIRKTIDYKAENGKEYILQENTAVLIVRPRGWHLDEKHIEVNGESISASLVDFGLYFYHNAQELLKRGTGPYFYLPKLENHLEARLWNDVFVFAQNELGIPQGSIKATVLIETIPAAFEMDEILYELKEHSAGLNCGRWDYIFSFIKKYHQDPNCLFPDRSQVTMEVPFMRAYSKLAIKTCHKRKAPAIGGMAAQIPIKNDEEANRLAFEKIRADKEREVQDGHDGTWVAHPGMVEFVKDIFDKRMPTPNQINKLLDIEINSDQLLEVPEGEITEQGLRTNVNVSIQYIEAWLSGRGAVPLNHLMEDAATAEISRAQVWQWIRHPNAILEDNQKITIEMIYEIVDEELAKIKKHVGEGRFHQGKYLQATDLFLQIIEDDCFVDFLTLPAYELLMKEEK